MPSDTLGNVLSQLQGVLDELYDTGRTTLTPDQIETLRRQVWSIQRDEDRKINAFHKPPREVRWDDHYFVVD